MQTKVLLKFLNAYSDKVFFRCASSRLGEIAFIVLTMTAVPSTNLRGTLPHFIFYYRCCRNLLICLRMARNLVLAEENVFCFVH